MKSSPKGISKYRERAASSIYVKAEQLYGQNAFKYTNNTVLDPAYRWMECLRISQLPIDKVPIEQGDMVLVPLSLIESLHRGIAPYREDMDDDFRDFFDTFTLFRSTEPESKKWIVEALLFAKVALFDIHIETKIPFYILEYYETYFCSVRDWTPLDMYSYIIAKTEATIQDGKSKFIASQMGRDTYKLFMGDLTVLDNPQTRSRITHLISQANLRSIIQGNSRDGNDIDTAMSIEIHKLRTLMVENKVALTGTSIGNDISVSGNLDEAFISRITASQNQAALQRGGRSAADSMKSATRSHAEATGDYYEAPKDRMTNEERHALGFQQKDNKKE